MEKPKRLRPNYDAELMDSAIVGITHRKKQSRSRKLEFVRKCSIDFTAEMWEIIEAHRNRDGVTDSLRETIYRGLLLLKKGGDI